MNLLFILSYFSAVAILIDDAVTIDSNTLNINMTQDNHVKFWILTESFEGEGGNLKKIKFF